MNSYTVNDLLNECLQLQSNGDGSKQIMISDGNGVNDYHPLYSGFGTDTDWYSDANALGCRETYVTLG